MHRAVALIAFLALSWSQLVALRCDMGTGAPKSDAESAMAHHAAPEHHAGTMEHAATMDAHRHTPDTAPLAQHGQSHGGNHGCLMIMACNYASVRHAEATVVTRFPAIFLRAAFLANPIPVAAELAVETPPPRLAI